MGSAERFIQCKEERGGRVGGAGAPTTNGGHASWRLRRNTCALRTRFFFFLHVRPPTLHARSVLGKQKFCIGVQSEVHYECVVGWEEGGEGGREGGRGEKYEKDVESGKKGREGRINVARERGSPFSRYRIDFELSSSGRSNEKMELGEREYFFFRPRDLLSPPPLLLDPLTHGSTL